MSEAAPPRAAPVVAMVGGGQLARMTHQAAISLGIRLKVLAREPDEPAVLAGAAYEIGDPANPDALARFVADADVLTFDHENVPAELLVELQRRGVQIAPGPHAMSVAHDKIRTREVLVAAGFPFAPYAVARSVAEINEFADIHGWPVVAKAPSGGYDGKGVWTLDDAAAAADLVDRASGPLLLEPRLTLNLELAAMVARSATGETVAYPVVETVQQNAVCRELLAPAPIGAELAQQAQDLARRAAETIDAVGILALELFVTPDGLLVNELALRPHNSGHYSIEGAVTSQFEQHLRAVLGWPLGSTTLTAPAVATVNVFGVADAGDPTARIPLAASVPSARLHWYSKSSRPGRKLGHVTVRAADADTARSDARRAASLLERGETS